MQITTTKVPAQNDWIAISKTLAIELVFLASSGAIVSGHATPDIINLAVATGLSLGVLRITDVVANLINVKSYLSNPNSGVVPQAINTPLVTTNGH